MLNRGQGGHLLPLEKFLSHPLGTLNWRQSHIHVHLCTAQSTRRFSGLVPFCLLPFRLLKIKLCHFAYSTFNLTLIDLFSILTFDVFSSYTDA